MTPRPPLTLRAGLGRALGQTRRLLSARPNLLAVERPRPASWPTTGLTACCLRHATVLARFDDVTVLFDPALLPRVGPRVGGRTVGPQRVSPPALHIDELPPLDAILISHAHADHMDTTTLAALPQKPRLLVPVGTADLVAGCGFDDVHEIAVGETVDVRGAIVEACVVRHYGRRHALDRARRGYCGYRVDHRGRSLFFGGDSAFHVFPPKDCARGVDVAAIGIGGYDPYVWNHATPEEAVAMARQPGARALLPMHWGTFLLSDEPLDEPMRRLLRAADGVCPIATRAIGEVFTVPGDEP